MYKLYLFFPVKAVGTNLAWLQSDGSNHIVETMIAKRSKVQLFADLIKHFVIVVRIRIGVILQNRFRHRTFPFLDHTAGDQIHLGFGTGEVQVFTSV